MKGIITKKTFEDYKRMINKRTIFELDEKERALCGVDWLIKKLQRKNKTKKKRK